MFSKVIRIVSLVTIMVATFAYVPSSFAVDTSDTRGFRKGVTVAGIREHQATFQSISNANGGNRLATFGGHDASAQYVYERAAAAGYDVHFQEFTFQLVSDRTPPVLQQVSPVAKTYVDGPDFQTMQYSGSGDVTAPVTAVDLNLPSTGGSTSGCEAADFAGFPAGTIALMQRGTCTFRAKAENALAAGAVGVIIFNEGNDPGRVGVLSGTLSPPVFSLPAVGTTFALGLELNGGVNNGPTGVVVHVKADTIAEVRTTRNVIAETPGGDPNHVIVIGAHLDSVSRGPGINDNGSGSAAILEIAEVFAAQGRVPRNKLRFAWWSAEEEGLIGSTFYVNSLSQAEKDAIELNLNFDMIGSPNFVRFVYDGNNSGGGGTVGPAGSGAIEQVFLDYFSSQGLASAPTPFNGRSDYGPFIAAGIPAGGLFTGAEGVKTAQQAAIYGGTAGAPYDPCYHLACDTYANNSNTALDQMSDATAHAILLFSKQNFAKNPLVDPVAASSTMFAGAAATRDDGLHAAHDAIVEK